MAKPGRLASLRAKRYVFFSMLCYAVALCLPAYEIGFPGEKQPAWGFECLQMWAVWAPWSANIFLAITWFLGWRSSKWTLVSAAASVVGGLSMIAMDWSLDHYFIGSFLWFVSIGLAVTAGVTLLRRAAKQQLFTAAMSSTSIDAISSQQSATSTPQTEQHVTS
jgi:hypothetical protein